MTDPTTYIALLRGINVGGHNRLAMADLRGVLEELGHEDVRTYVQSGNAVFTSGRTDPDAIGTELTRRLAADLDVAPAVMVRTAEELATIVDGNPFAEQARQEPTTVHAGFLASRPTEPSSLDVHAEQYAPEQFALADRVVYLHLPDGMGRSRLAVDLGRRLSDVGMTVRNWRTVTRLLDMTRMT